MHNFLQSSVSGSQRPQQSHKSSLFAIVLEPLVLCEMWDVRSLVLASAGYSISQGLTISESKTNVQDFQKHISAASVPLVGLSALSAGPAHTVL